MLLDRETTFASFDFGLDRRLVKAVARMGFVYPTLVSTKSCHALVNYDDKMYYLCIRAIQSSLSSHWILGSLLTEAQYHVLDRYRCKARRFPWLWRGRTC